MTERTSGAPASAPAKKTMTDRERAQYTEFITNMLKDLPDSRLKLVYRFALGLTAPANSKRG